MTEPARVKRQQRPAQTAKGGSLKAENNPQAKLTWVLVDAIRADKRSQRTLAKIYGVSRTAIQSVKHGRTWMSK